MLQGGVLGTFRGSAGVDQASVALYLHERQVELLPLEKRDTLSPPQRATRDTVTSDHGAQIRSFIVGEVLRATKASKGDSACSGVESRGLYSPVKVAMHSRRARGPCRLRVRAEPELELQSCKAAEQS